MHKTVIKRRQMRSAVKFMEYGTVFAAGGAGYGILEMMWRGYTHWTMILTGGGCLCCIYAWLKAHPNAAWWKSCLISMSVITGFELAVGMIVNVWLKWNIWDYSRFKTHLFGQICLPYSLLWGLLGIPIRYICLKLKNILA